MSATGSSNNKRTRFDDTRNTSQQSTSITTPTEAADCVVRALTANGSLQESQKQYFREELFTEFLELRKNLKHFDERISQLRDTDFVLKSAHFNFKLTPTARLKEEEKAAVETLNNRVASEILIMQSNLKDHVNV